ncbi:MAG: hypothetical protein RL490_780, partial [Pseudomonadota bacterium]
AAPAAAATYNVDLTGVVADFQNVQFDSLGSHYDRNTLQLAGLDATNAITVAQGDTIKATVTLDQLYTMPASALYTNFLHYFTGSAFPSQSTEVNGSFNLFNAGTLVATFAYSSSTADQLSSYALISPPDNGAFSFDSFTNDVTITTLATPATIDGSAFTYDLVSTAVGGVPEPSTWAMLVLGFGVIGGTLRKRARMPQIG